MEDVTFPDYYPMYNDTDDPEDPEVPEVVYLIIQIINIVICSITFILGITGNGLVIWIAGFKMKKTVTILWFLNLAIADFVVDLTSPLLIAEWIMEAHWPFGQAMCKVVFTVLYLNMSVSTSFLMVISVDRCTSVMCPLWSKNHRSTRLALNISYTIWLVCFMLSSPYFAFFDIIPDSENESILYCLPLYADDSTTHTTRYQTMVMVRFVSMFLIPFSIIVTCYGLILFRLRRSRSLSRSNRPLKVIVTIIFSFFWFWFLFHMWPLLDVLGVDLNINVDLIVTHVAYCIGFFNSCVNPIVYVFAGRDFKKSFFRSIPFLLEDTFKEKDLPDNRINQTVMENQMESYDL